MRVASVVTRHDSLVEGERLRHLSLQHMRAAVGALVGRREELGAPHRQQIVAREYTHVAAMTMMCEGQYTHVCVVSE